MEHSDLEVQSKLYDPSERILSHLTSDSVPKRVHINQLPDDCLVSIFEKRFSLQAMVTELRPICTRWKNVIEFSICQPKKSLKLFSSKNDIRQYCQKLIDLNLYADEKFKLRNICHYDHDFVLHSFWRLDSNLDSFQSMATLFPNVNHLVLGFWHIPFCFQEKFCHFIRNWPNLSHLSLFTSLSKLSFQNDSAINTLYQTINSLNCLTHLDLLGDAFMEGTAISTGLDQMLSRLRHFAIVNYNYDLIENVIDRLSEGLHSLRLDDFKITVETLQRFLKNHPQWSTSLTELRLSKVKDWNVVNFVCEHFSMLKRLELDFDLSLNVSTLLKTFSSTYIFLVYKISIILQFYSVDGKLMFELNKLTHLESLAMDRIRIHIPFDSSHRLKPTICADHLRSLQIAQVDIRPTTCAGDMIVSHLALLFPNLKQLDYKFGFKHEKGPFDSEKDFGVDKNYFLKHFGSLNSCQVYHTHNVEEFMGRHRTSFAASYDQWIYL